MKKTFLSLTALMMCLTMTLTFISCGDDKDDSSDPQPSPETPIDDGTIYGYWRGYVPNGYDTGLDWHELAAIYDHQVFYMFDRDGNYEMLTAFYGTNESNEKIENIINNAKSIDEVIKSINWGEIDIVYFKGTFTSEGNKIVLNPKEISEFHNWNKKWVKTSKSKTGLGKMTYTYSLADGKLTLSTDKAEYAHFNSHHTLIATMSRMANIAYPDVPEMDALVGDWRKDNNEILRFDVEGGCSYTTYQYNQDGYSPKLGRHYDTIETQKVGTYVHEGDILKITWTYTHVGYLEDGHQKDVELINIAESDRIEEEFGVTVGETTMTLWGDTWTKQGE